MSFHGGLIGVITAMIWFAHKTQRHFFTVADFVAPLIPFGLGVGRIGNFMNGELWGGSPMCPGPSSSRRRAPSRAIRPSSTSSPWKGWCSSSS